nr:hypothetical protein [uncultured Halomonas sp.]
MVKTPWSTLAAALVMSLGLAACDSGGEEAPESTVSETNANAQPAQSTQDGMTEAGENTAEMAEQAGNDSDAAGDPAAGDPAAGANTGEQANDEGSDGIDSSVDVDNDWESTEKDVDSALKEAERRFEEAEKELDEQFKAAEKKDVTEELEIEEPGQPTQQ